MLNVLSEVTSKFRIRVSDTLSTPRKHNTPLPEATTVSNEALHAYSTGRKVFGVAGPLAARPDQPVLRAVPGGPPRRPAVRVLEHQGMIAPGCHASDDRQKINIDQEAG